MKHLLLFCAALLVSMLATAQWAPVLNPGFSAGEANYTSLAISPDGVPYVAYSDGGNEFKATVMKLNGNSWETVGIAGFSTGEADFTSLAFSPDGMPYVAYVDGGSSLKATVMKFNGTAWVTVGTAGFSARGAAYTSLAFSPDGVAYVAYKDGGNGGKATVMKFNGTSWETVGNAGFSASEVQNTSLAFSPEGVPYVAYQDGNVSIGKATVMKFNGIAWLTVGNAGFSAVQTNFTSLAISPEGVPYVAYQDINGATVMKFNGTAWVTAGILGLAFYTSLAFSPDGVPYVAYSDGDNDDLKATVMKFTGTDWETVGTAGFSAGQANFTSLAFSPDGVPYVAYSDRVNGSKVTIMVYNSITTATLSGTYCPGASVPVSFTANGYYSTTNSFIAQLSNAEGGFASPVTIGLLAPGGSGAIQATIPSNTQAGSSYRIRVVASNPAIIGSDDGQDLAINQLNTYYEDYDHDGYGNAAVIRQACSQPEGYVTDSTDCNDSSKAVHLIIWIKDSDGDGYYSDIVTQCTSPGAEYVIKTNQQAGDCDDNDPTLNPTTVWYKDADNDGYSDGTTLTQCAKPSGYRLATALIAISGDCNDADTSQHPGQVWYKDADGDRYSDGTTLTQCARPSDYKLQSELIQTNGDCNDSDPAVHSPITYYRDADGDGYGSSVSAPFCSSTAPAGYSARTGDFNDNDPAISPGAVEVCGNKVDDNCNGIVDENPCYACQNGTNLTTTSITSNSAQLNWNATANPQQWQLEYKTTASGSKWTDVLLTGNIRSVKLSSLKANQTYNWHIRAKCNGTWTAYSSSVAFKTAAGITSSIVSSAVAANPSTLSLYPNPTMGQFVVELNIADRTNTNAKIQLADLTGRTVQTENAEINYGTLKKTVNISSALAKGVYMVRIMANGKVYIAKLVYEK